MCWSRHDAQGRKSGTVPIQDVGHETGDLNVERSIPGQGELLQERS